MFIIVNKCYQEQIFISLPEQIKHCPQKLLFYSCRILEQNPQISSSHLVVFGEHSWATFENISSGLDGSLGTGR